MENKHIKTKLIGKDIPMLLAMKDISNYLKEKYPYNHAGCNDKWIVTFNYMVNKKVRYLNKLLGLHKINKYGNQNGINKSKNNDTNYLTEDELKFLLDTL